MVEKIKKHFKSRQLCQNTFPPVGGQNVGRNVPENENSLGHLKITKNSF